MKCNFLYGVLLVVMLTSCGSSDKPAHGDAGKDSSRARTSARHIHTANFNCDTLKGVFSRSPYQYLFGDEKLLEGTTEAHFEGKERQSRDDVDFQNSIIINFDKNTRKVRNIVFYINHANNNVNPKQLTRLFEFLDHFDPKASKYILKNFNAVFYDLNAHNALSPYENDDLGLKMTVVQSLFDSRRFQKKADSKTSDQDYIAVAIVFT